MINFKNEVAKAIKELVAEMEENEIAELLEVPPNPEMGDYAFPCFKLAKIFRKAPPMIAEEIAGKISENEMFEKVVNTAGYVNFYINKAIFLEAVLKDIDKSKEDYGKSDIGAGKKVIVEYSSPNIAKPFHIGHIRSTVIGNAINNIYKFAGYETVTINHLGDYGTQFGKMIVAYKLWGNEEEVKVEPIKTLLKLYIRFHEEAEINPDLEDQARDIFRRLEAGEEEIVKLWQWFKDESLKEFGRVYDMLGIKFDSYDGESFYSDKMDKILDLMNEKNLLEESEGASIVNLEEFNMASAVVTKKDGSTLYATRDLAAAVYRKETYNFDKNIYVVASQQNLHFQQIFKMLELMGYEWSKDCIHVPFGLISLAEGTMSTRAGRVVFLEDVLTKAVDQTKAVILEKGVNTDNVEEIAKQVGIGAVIFQELSNNRIKDYEFSWERTLNFEGETGPYAQYTHARACSLLRKAEVEVDTDIDYNIITTESSYELIKLLYKYKKVVEDAVNKNEPSVVTRYIITVAQAFNKFYHDEHIIVEDKNAQKARLLVVKSTKEIVASGLSLIGVHAPERM